MKRIPSHWWLSGIGKARDAEEIFRFTQVAGGRAATFRKLLRIGPFGFCVIRYRPDQEATITELVEKVNEGVES